MRMNADGDDRMRRAIGEVREAQRLIKDPCYHHEVSLVIAFAEEVAGRVGEDVVANDLIGFARLIHEGLFD